MTTEQLTFAGVVLSILIGLYKDSRDRKWKIEDLARQDRVAKELADGLDKHRIALAEKVERTADKVADKVERAAESATERMVGESAKLKVAIDENTDVSKRAFHEANGAKELIAAEIKQRNEIALSGQLGSPTASTVLSQIETNTAATADAVKNLKEP